MRLRNVRRILGLGAAIAIAVGAFSQGAYWESKTSGGPIQGERFSTMYYSPKMFKHVPKGDDEQTIIVRLDKEVMYTLHPKDKTYSEMTFAELEKFMQQMTSRSDSKMAALQEKMKNMPEEQRKMMEKMMGNRMPGKAKESVIEVTNAGEKKSISGYSCTKFVVTQDGNEMMQMWTTKEVKIFDAMRKDFEEYSKRMASMSPMMGKGYLDAMRKIEGFPIETQMGDIVTVITKVEKRSNPGSEFEVPAGYTKVKSKLAEEAEKMEKGEKEEK